MPSPSQTKSLIVGQLAQRGLLPTSQIFYVGSTHDRAVDSASAGLSADSPLATLDYAVGRCTANRGDVIVLLPGHAENVASAGAIDLDVAGVYVLGMGQGPLRPTFTFTADTADIDIDAANITLENLVFVANSDDVAAAIDVNSTGCTIRNCFFNEPTTNKAFTVCILGGTTTVSDYLTIEDCVFRCPDAAASSGVRLVGGTLNIVRRCLFQGDWTAGAIDLDNTPTFNVIADNIIFNADDTNDNCILASATATGSCVRNLVSNAAAQANQITATAMGLNENYASVNGEDLNGILEPIAT